jgi:hypothetical protein
MTLKVFEHSSCLGRWRVAARRADPRLRGYVHGFVVSEGYSLAAVREWHMPSLEVAVVLNFASPHRILDTSEPKRATDYRRRWVGGLHSRHRLTWAVGARDFSGGHESRDVLAVDLAPPALRPAPCVSLQKRPFVESLSV